jgi:Amt family ammonium transporter
MRSDTHERPIHAASRIAAGCTFALLLSIATGVQAATVAPIPPAISKADTLWVLLSAALVVFMTLPGLALFYGGLVRS